VSGERVLYETTAASVARAQLWADRLAATPRPAIASFLDDYYRILLFTGLWPRPEYSTLFDAIGAAAVDLAEGDLEEERAGELPPQAPSRIVTYAVKRLERVGLSVRAWAAQIARAS